MRRLIAKGWVVAMGNVIEVMYATAAALFVLGFVMAWQQGRLAKLVVREVAARLVQEAADKAARRARKAVVEIRLAEASRLLSDFYQHRRMIELSEPILANLETSIGDEIEKFTCDGCDSEYRRSFPGHVRWYGLEFCSEDCRRNPLPFDAPAITVVNAIEQVDRLLN